MKVYINYTEEVPAGTIFRDTKLKSDLYTGKLKLIYAPDKIVTYDCVSNGWGRRPCDAGIWICREIIEHKQPQFKGSKQYWFAYMEPQFETDQTGIGTHVDNWPPGTMGCNGVPNGPDEAVRMAIAAEIRQSGYCKFEVFHNLTRG